MPQSLWISLLGAVVGALLALTGAGGFVIVPALQRRTNLDLASIQATSLNGYRP
jgi:uncharacterized membrane protein YfcA